MVWYSDWPYRKRISLNGQDGAGTDYQIKLSIGDSAGGDFHLEGHCTDFPNDIRFTDDDGETLLSYWIEDITTDPISVWIKITDDLDTNQNIYVYYGKLAESNLMDGVSTFIFFDNFDDNSLDTDKWNKRVELGTITEQNGRLECGGGSTSAPYGHTALDSKSLTTFRIGIIEGKLYLAANGISEVGFRGGADNTGYKNRADARGGQGVGHLKPPYASWNFLANGGATGVAVGTGAWKAFKLTVYDDDTTCSMTTVVDGQTKNSSDTSYATQEGRISLQNHYGSYTYYDDIRVRKYVATEPSFGSADSEEEVPISSSNPLYFANDGKLHFYGRGKQIVFTTV